jgi:hypothetical protein
MLDTFLEVSSHLQGLKKLEKQRGLTLHVNHRRVVPWSERERFEQLYAIHLEMVRVQTEKIQKQQRQSRRVSTKERAERAHSKRHGSPPRSPRPRPERGASVVQAEEIQSPDLVPEAQVGERREGILIPWVGPEY